MPMLKSLPVLLLVWTSSGLVAQAEQDVVPKDPEKYVGKVRAELLLDDATGLLTYQLRNISDEPVKIHLQSLEGVEIEFHIEPDVAVTKVKVDSDDEVNPEANVKTLPYGEKTEMIGVGSPRWDEIMREREREKAMDRVVELKKHEAVSRSFYLYDTPWFDALVKKLETKKFKAYRIDPLAFVETADAEGKPVTDHQIEICNFERQADGVSLKLTPDGKLKEVYYTGGLIFDLARAKKIQALKAAEKKQVQEKK